MLPILNVIKTLKEQIDLAAVSTILDLGCGSFHGHKDELYKERDILTTVFSGKDITGIDIFEEDIVWRNKYGPPGKYILKNIMDFDITCAYDVIICHHTLEHLTQEEHDTILNRMEEASYKYLILGGPVGYSPNTAFEVSTGNIHQRHQIGLQPVFYKDRGYKIFIFDSAFLAIKENQ